MRFAVEKKILLGFIVSVIALALTGWLSYRATTRLTGTLDMVTHTQKAIASIESVSAVLTRVETEQRGYLLTGSEKSLSDSKAATLQLQANLSQLRKLTADNPAQQRYLNDLEELVNRRLTLLEERISVYQRSGLQAAAEITAAGKGKEVMDQVRRVIAQMHAEEDRLLLQREREARESSQLSTIIITGSSVLAIAVGLVAVIVIRRDLVLREQADLKLQESQALLESILDNTPAIVFLKDLEGRYLFVNRRFEQVTKKSRQELRGKTTSDIASPELADQSRERLQMVLANQSPVEFEEIVEHPDGRRPHYAVKFPIRNTGGKIYAIACISLDITERKKAEAEIFASSQEIQAANRKLHAANKELEAFSYSVSHDLRAPLRHIDGFVDLLSKHAGNELDDRGRRYLKIIGDAARQMGALIDDLLVFSRMGRSELREQTVDMNALIHETVGSFQSELNGRTVNWKIESLPQVQADAAMLRQVAINLLSNAVKYTRPRDPAIIEVGYDLEAAQEHKFFVRDNGVGFDMAYADKLFGVFQRLHRADEFEGTGIGLANVRRIIARHGGRTWAESKVDGGATFFFTLPKSKSNPA